MTNINQSRREELKRKFGLTDTDINVLVAAGIITEDGWKLIDNNNTKYGEKEERDGKISPIKTIC